MKLLIIHKENKMSLFKILICSSWLQTWLTSYLSWYGPWLFGLDLVLTRDLLDLTWDLSYNVPVFIWVFIRTCRSRLGLDLALVGLDSGLVGHYLELTCFDLGLDLGLVRLDLSFNCVIKQILTGGSLNFAEQVHEVLMWGSVSLSSFWAGESWSQPEAPGAFWYLNRCDSPSVYFLFLMSDSGGIPQSPALSDWRSQWTLVICWSSRRDELRAEEQTEVGIKKSN